MKQAFSKLLSRDSDRRSTVIPGKCEDPKKEPLISPVDPPPPPMQPPSSPEPPPKLAPSNPTSMLLTKYTGSCHCGLVTFEVVAPRKLPVYDCK